MTSAIESVGPTSSSASIFGTSRVSPGPVRGEQSGKLMQTIGSVVANPHRLETILPASRALGRQHGGYGVESHHYASVGAALLDTLEQRLGPAFTEEVCVAWAAAYGLLSSAMIEAAEGAGGAAAPDGRHDEFSLALADGEGSER